jgi:hypothetical protein
MWCACPSQRGSLKHLSKHPLKKELVGFPAWGIAQIFWNHTEEEKSFCACQGIVRARRKVCGSSLCMVLLFRTPVSGRFFAFNPYYYRPAGDNRKPVDFSHRTDNVFFPCPVRKDDKRHRFSFAPPLLYH